MTTASQLPSMLRVQEHAVQLVIELELPKGEEEGFELDLARGVLTVKVERPQVERDEWRMYADATPC